MDTLLTLAPLVLLMGVMYFLLIRPQRKRQQQHRDLVRSLKRGDNVISAGGIYGTIKKINEDSVIIETEGSTTLKIQKHSIAERT